MKNNNWEVLFKIFWSFFRIGAFTIGGGYAMLPLMEKEFVDNQKWVTHEEIVDIFAVVQSVPGVIAINTSIFIGYKIGGIKYAVAAALGVILPSFLIILVIAFFLLNVKDNIYIGKAFTGVRAGVTAMIAITAIKLGKSVIKNKLGLVLAVLSFAAIAFFDIHAIYAIVSGALIGYIAFGLSKTINKKK